MEVPIEGESNELVRLLEPKSAPGLIQTDQHALDAYRKRRQKEQNLQQDINTLKARLSRIEECFLSSTVNKDDT